jgi:hypothetical protein
MHKLRNASLIVLAAGLTLGLADAANARGGRARGRLGVAIRNLAPPQNPQASVTPAGSPAAVQRLSPAALSAISTAAAPTPAPTTPPPPPTSAIAAPADQVPTIAPLSPAVTTTTLTAGGTARTDSSSPSSTSPTEAAPSIAGGGGKTLQDCMGFWDQATHMTKAEWKAACLRSQHRLDGVANEIGPGMGKVKR